MTTSTKAVETKPNKAIVGSIIAFVLGIAVGVEELIPDPTVKLVCQLITLVGGTAGTAFGVYQTTNTPK